MAAFVEMPATTWYDRAAVVGTVLPTSGMVKTPLVWPGGIVTVAATCVMTGPAPVANAWTVTARHRHVRRLGQEQRDARLTVAVALGTVRSPTDTCGRSAMLSSPTPSRVKDRSG